jgi:hypothetical protein
MKRQTPEEIVTLLREAEGSSDSIIGFCRRKGTSDQTFDRWRQQHNTSRPRSALGYKTPAQMAAAYANQIRKSLISSGLKKRGGPAA